MDLFLRSVFGIVYTAGYLLAILFTIGAGHGSTLLFSALPTWLLFLICLGLLSGSESREVRKAIVVLMVLNYVLTAVLFLTFELDDWFLYTLKYFKLEPVVFVLSVVWYLLGQLVFWLLYVRRGRIFVGELS
jgi:hypothetical protein